MAPDCHSSPGPVGGTFAYLSFASHFRSLTCRVTGVRLLESEWYVFKFSIPTTPSNDEHRFDPMFIITPDPFNMVRPCRHGWGGLLMFYAFCDTDVPDSRSHYKYNRRNKDVSCTRRLQLSQFVKSSLNCSSTLILMDSGLYPTKSNYVGIHCQAGIPWAYRA